MQAPKLFKQNIEMLYNISEMQTNNSEFFLIIKSKFKPIIVNNLPYYDWLLSPPICRIVILHF